jgi:RHS repeat-associated protein
VLRASLRIKRRGGSWVAHVYSYDDNDRVTRYENLIPTGNWDDAVDYTYDDTNQLVEEDTWNSYQDNAYEYDLAGNRTEKDGTAQTVVAGNRVTNDGTYTYAYDEEGNLIKRTTTASGNERQLIYDFRNRLIEVKDFTGTIAGGTLKTDVKYEYDTLNRRVHTWLDTNGDGSSDREEFYVYDGDDVVLDFVDANGATGGVTPTVAMRYLHGPAVDQLLAQEDVNKSTSADDRTLWMLADLLGSTRDIADNAGNGVSHISYDAFGNVPSNIVLLTRYLWTGREFEITTGLQYNRNRWYDPALGRWTSEDPIGFNGGDYNVGRYVGNEPLGWNDPFGLSTWSDIKRDFDRFIDQLLLRRPEWNYDDAPSAFGKGTDIGAAPKRTVVGVVPDFLGTQASCPRGLGNPFKGKSAAQIDQMFRTKGFDPRGPSPITGKGGYVDPKNGRSYHIDPNNSYGEPPHVDVNRLKDYNGPLGKKKYPY